ncbi:hypothetical protein [Cuniculiplasma divulgatum]|uniref:Uncharacterized protein n=1 Tax=Cuniculiplasma divulgatum TaxID=1673428 RepID=A0A1R4A6D6_9ARCH|nr:hypothetical protein [Cuniculiplasma divulgatum]SJK84522.1 hypothetical protein CPM_0659 [Cuniculiplasma divulgatum]
MKTGDEALWEQIQQRRGVSFSDSSVIYNLKTGFDFNNVRIMVLHLANVIFEKEISKWVDLNGNRIEKVPGYNITMMVPELGERRVKALNKKFWKQIWKLMMHSEPGKFQRNTLVQNMKYASPLPNPLMKYSILRHAMKSWIKNMTSELEKNILTQL